MATQEISDRHPLEVPALETRPRVQGIPIAPGLDIRAGTAPMTLIAKVKQFLASPWLEKTQRISEFYWSLKTQFYYTLFFGHVGKKSKLIQPMELKTVRYIEIGDRVLINKHVFLLTLPENESSVPRLVIGDGCVIGHMNHITCMRKVQIGKNVLTADRVFISDHSHQFSNANIPIMHQPSVVKGNVSIGDGTWIGENVAILSCNIGKNCVIGSNAVVLKDVPDFSVAVGIPARVVQRFNQTSQTWERVESSR